MIISSARPDVTVGATMRNTLEILLRRNVTLLSWFRRNRPDSSTIAGEFHNLLARHRTFFRQYEDRTCRAAFAVRSCKPARPAQPSDDLR